MRYGFWVHRSRPLARPETETRDQSIGVVKRIFVRKLIRNDFINPTRLSVKMSIIFLGDETFGRLLSDGAFQARLDHQIRVCMVSNMMTFKQYTTLLPEGAEFIVVGCLGPLLANLTVSKVEKRDVTLSK